MKTILITGASSGIGYDTVRALIASQFKVVATVRNQKDADELTQNFSAQVIPIQIDLSDFKKIEQLPELLQKTHNIEKLDGLVNNAGLALAAPFLNQDFNEIESIIRLNVLAVMKITQTLLPLLGATENSEHTSKIINISSVAGKSAAPFLSIYAASKHAIEGFSEALRKELMLFNIQVVVVAPGSIKTPIWNKGFNIIKDKYNNTLFAKPFQKFVKIASSEEKNALPVTAVSEIIVDVFNSSEPNFRYAPIPRKFQNWYLPMLIPKKLYNRLTAKALGLGSVHHKT
jgi:short-subunit dehydrogenase